MKRTALFHYVPGQYMHYLHFVSSQACTCALPPAEVRSALANVAMGVYHPVRRLSKLDENQINATWGNTVPRYQLLRASGRNFGGIKGDLARLRELTEAFPEADWLLLLPVDHFVIAKNLALRIKELNKNATPLGSNQGTMVYGPPPVADRQGELEKLEEPAGSLSSEGSLLLSRDLARTIFSFEKGLAEEVFPAWWLPGDRSIVAWTRTLPAVTVIEDSGLIRWLPGPAEGEHVRCPATFPMDPDLADLKPEFTKTESEAIMSVTYFLLQSTTEKECATRLYTTKQ